MLGGNFLVDLFVAFCHAYVGIGGGTSEMVTCLMVVETST